MSYRTVTIEGLEMRLWGGLDGPATGLKIGNPARVEFVTLPNGLRMGKFPVTNAEYGCFLRATARDELPTYWGDSCFNQPDQPVVGVSWHDAQAFCKWGGYRLPTDEEWEYACRAGTTTEFSFGDGHEMLLEYGWFVDNSRGSTHSVGQKKSNPWGLSDMHGNVWEWCQSGNDNRRVLRGGSWYNLARYARSAYRDGNIPDDRSYGIGFRVVLHFETNQY